MRAVLAILVVCGCGGSSRTTPPVRPVAAATPTTGSGAPPATPPAAALDLDAVCKRIVDLGTQRCGKFAEIGVDASQCVGQLREAVADPTFKAFADCVMNPSCEEVTNCLAAADQADGSDGGDGAGSPQKLRGCKDSSASGDAVGIPKAEWATRNGANLARYSQAVSTKALPIEMCGIPAENRWLGTLTCDDGSRPVKSSVDAENFRAGNVGDGGRCGSILDLYKIACPEKTYDIYIDAYICPLEP